MFVFLLLNIGMIYQKRKLRILRKCFFFYFCNSKYRENCQLSQMVSHFNDNSTQIYDQESKGSEESLP